MQLNQTEQKLVAKVRARCVKGRRNIGGLFFATFATLVMLYLSDFDWSSLRLLLPIGDNCSRFFDGLSHFQLLLIGVWVACVIDAVENWNGNASDVILLRLLDQQATIKSESCGVASTPSTSTQGPVNSQL